MLVNVRNAAAKKLNISLLANTVEIIPLRSLISAVSCRLAAITMLMTAFEVRITLRKVVSRRRQDSDYDLIWQWVK